MEYFRLLQYQLINPSLSFQETDQSKVKIFISQVSFVYHISCQLELKVTFGKMMPHHYVVEFYKFEASD
jgi:hypothetical protein